MAPGARRGLARLAATSGGAALAAMVGWGVIVVTAGESAVLTGFLLLVLGALSLGALYVAIGWAEDGFRGNDSR